MSFIHGRIGTLKIQGEATPVYFNLNTCAYFDANGKRRLIPILLNVFKAVQQSGGDIQKELSVEAVFEHLDFPAIRLLAAAALHRYDKNDEPEHPHTPGQLGAYLGADDWGKLLPMLQKGALNFLAGQKDLPRSAQREDEDEPNPTPAPAPQKNGGAESSALDAEILGSLEESSDGKPSGDSSSDGKPGNSNKPDETSEPADSTP